MKHKGLPNDIGNWDRLTDFVLFFFRPLLESVGIFFAIWETQYLFKFSGCAYASILGTLCSASNTSFTSAIELGFAIHEMKLITGLPISGDLYEEYVRSEEELRQLKIKDWPRGFYKLLVALFDIHIHLPYKNGEKMVYHKQCLNRHPYPVLWELFERPDLGPSSSILEM